jgi:MerR family transcriptional regulator, light-induced transcriptional regulator
MTFLNCNRSVVVLIGKSVIMKMCFEKEVALVYSNLGGTLRNQEHSLAKSIVELQCARQPEVWKSYGHPGREKSVRDAEYHLSYLAEALDANDPALFSEYLAWVKVLFAGLKLPEHTLTVTLGCTRQVLAEKLPDEIRALALNILDVGIQDLDDAPMTIPSFIEGNTPLDELAREYLEALLSGDRQTASHLVLDSVQKGVSIKSIYIQVFQRCQREIGRLWQTNQIGVAQEHFCTAATQMVMSQLYPYIFSGERKNHRLVAACVGGELHEIGARMVADFFEMAGWDTYFLGANTPPESIVRTVVERQADVLALSATMTFHVVKVADLIASLRASGGSPRTRILVGGYPFNLSPELWMRVGADGYASDAETAILEAERMLLT